MTDVDVAVDADVDTSEGAEDKVTVVEAKELDTDETADKSDGEADATVVDSDEAADEATDEADDSTLPDCEGGKSGKSSRENLLTKSLKCSVSHSFL